MFHLPDPRALKPFKLSPTFSRQPILRTVTDGKSFCLSQKKGINLIKKRIVSAKRVCVICELQSLNKCIKLFPGPLCLSVSELYWIVKREVKKEMGGALVVFLTKELLCGATERGTISVSLCFILEWLQRKIINTMKSKILSEESSRKQPCWRKAEKSELVSCNFWGEYLPAWTGKQQARCCRRPHWCVCIWRRMRWMEEMFLDGRADDRCRSKPTLISWAIEWTHNNRPLTKETSAKRAKWKKWKTVCMQMEKLTIQ